MGKELKEKGQSSIPERQLRKKVVKVEMRPAEPQNFKEYLQIAILKRKSSQKKCFAKEDQIAAKIQSLNAKVLYQQHMIERLREEGKQDKVSRQNTKIQWLAIKLRQCYREMMKIKETLEDFYREAREEYIFG